MGEIHQNEIKILKEQIDSLKESNDK